MESIQALIDRDDHESILTLGPEYNNYKVIAAIHLGRYEEALLLLDYPCFEKAYCFYKLRKFHKSLKICKKLEGKNIDILKAQNLYFLGYYSDAYKILSNYGVSDEYAVNLSSMEALNHLNIVNFQKPSLFTSRDTKAIDSLKKYKFKDSECAMESNYNLSFKNIEDERLFIQTLSELDQKYNIENNCIQKQLKNLMDEDIVGLGARETEIFNFNRGTVTNINNPVLFQNNFLDSVKTDFKIFKDYQNNSQDYLRGQRNIDTFNDKLKLLKSLVILKRKLNDERKDKIKKTLKGVKSCLEKDIIQLLIGKDDDFQKKGIELLMSLSNK